MKIKKKRNKNENTHKSPKNERRINLKKVKVSVIKREETEKRMNQQSGKESIIKREKREKGINL